MRVLNKDKFLAVGNLLIATDFIRTIEDIGNVKEKGDKNATK